MYERLKSLREDNDLRQIDVAKHLNITQKAYSKYERGDRHIPTEALIKLSEFYNTSVDYLLDCTDVKKPYPRKK